MSTRIAIIGGGVIGCSIALALRQRSFDFDVTVLERHGAVGHGSTSASCGIVRRFYSEPGMIAMANEGAHIWADWDDFIGPIDDDRIRFPRPGMLFIPPRIDDAVRGIVREMSGLGINVSILTPDEVAARFPFLDISSQFPPRQPDDKRFFDKSPRRIEGAVFEADAGYVISPGLAVQNLQSAAERDGVEFRLRCEVTEIRQVGGRRFRIQATGGIRIDADAVVNAGGPHSAIINRLAGVELGLETRPLRREVHAMRNPLFDATTGSSVPIIGDLDAGIYCRPEAGGRDLIVGSTDPDCDAFDWVDDPDNYNDNISEAYWQRQSLRLMKRIPEVLQGPPRGIAALYDVTVEDWYPIVDSTDLPGYYVAIGTSGSSFKTAPVLGSLMAQVVDECEQGRNTVTDPIRFALPRTGKTIDTRFLSRSRGQIQSTGTVIG